MEKITILDNTLFGENVHIYDHNHRFSNPNIAIKDQGYTTSIVHIGKHCWIGSNVTILKGAFIGDNCVIAAGCVIDQNVPSNTIVRRNSNTIILEPIRSSKY